MSGLLKPSKVFLFLFLSILFCSQKIISQELYWVGGSGSWDDPAHWSETSGGPGGADVPGPTDDVYFDDRSFTESGQTVKIKGEAVCKDFIWKVLIL